MKDSPTPRVEITVQVHPRGHREMVRLEGEIVHVWVTAPPVDGAANEAVLALIARVAGVPPRSVSLVRGASSRHKRIAIVGISAEGVRARIDAEQLREPKRRD